MALRHESLRAYCDYTETPNFLAGVEALVKLADERSTTILCSESVWWRRLRRLLADYLVLVRGANVDHFMHDGRLTPHLLTDGVRFKEAPSSTTSRRRYRCRRSDGDPPLSAPVRLWGTANTA